jgi:hypothetical protein
MVSRLLTSSPASVPPGSTNGPNDTAKWHGSPDEEPTTKIIIGPVQPSVYLYNMHHVSANLTEMSTLNSAHVCNTGTHQYLSATVMRIVGRHVGSALPARMIHRPKTVAPVLGRSAEGGRRSVASTGSGSSTSEVKNGCCTLRATPARLIRCLTSHRSRSSSQPRLVLRR